MINFVPTSAVDALPGAALNADAADAAATGGDGAFGNVLEQLMGTASAKSTGVDLPLEEDGEFQDDAELDDLANAGFVVDPAAQPINRLVLAPTWVLTDATATSVASGAAVDSTVAERSVSAPTAMSQPPAGVEMPAPTASTPSAFEALMPDADTASHAASPEGMTLPDGVVPPPQNATRTPAAETAALPIGATANAAAESQAVATPTPESPGRERSTAAGVPDPAQKNEKGEKGEKGERSEKHEQGRSTFRVTAEAGHRAYAAAASEGTAKDSTNHGSSDAHSDPRASADQATANNPAATAFPIIAERPAMGVGTTLAASAAVPADALETAVATELPAQVVQSIRMQAIDGGGEAIVRLNPDYLGELVVAVKVEQGAVTAALQSDVPAVRKWVEANEGTLRQALAEHGLQLDRLTVSSDAPAAETGERGEHREDPREEEAQPESRRQRKKAPDATFEVVV